VNIWAVAVAYVWKPCWPHVGPKSWL